VDDFAKLVDHPILGYWLNEWLPLVYPLNPNDSTIWTAEQHAGPLIGCEQGTPGILRLPGKVPLACINPSAVICH
jgi:hypothetical protein